MEHPVSLLLQACVYPLCEDKNSCVFDVQNDEKGLFVQISVASLDFGRVIGKRGMVMQSIRQIVRSYAKKRGERISIKLLEPEGSMQQESSL